jgi:hypothetical protein
LQTSEPMPPAPPVTITTRSCTLPVIRRRLRYVQLSRTLSGCSS